MKKIILVFLLCIPLFAQRSLITRVSLDSAKTTLNTRIDSLLACGITDSVGVSGLVHDSINTRFGGSTTTSITNTTKTLIDDSLAGYTKFISIEGGATNRGIAVFYDATGQYITSIPITITADVDENTYTIDLNGSNLFNADSVEIDGHASIDSAAINFLIANLNASTKNIISIDTVSTNKVILAGENISTKINTGDSTNQFQINALSANVSTIYDSLQAIVDYINSFLPIIANIDPPTLTSVTADDDSSLIRLVFSFDALSDSGIIQRGLSESSFANLDTVNEDETTYRDTTTLGNTNYYYRLYSYNTLTTSTYSSVLSATTIDTSAIPEVIADYYLSNDGNDSWDGYTPATAWKTLVKLNSSSLTDRDSDGDTVVAFNGTDVFSDASLNCKQGVKYTSYGTGIAIIGDSTSTLTTNATITINFEGVMLHKLKIYGYKNALRVIEYSLGDLTIDSCEIIGGQNSHANDWTYGMYQTNHSSSGADDVSITYSKFHGIGFACIYWAFPMNWDVSYNEFYDLWMDNGKADWGGLVIASANTITESGEEWDCDYTVNVHHNLVHDFEYGTISIPSRGIAEYNEIYGNLDERLYFGGVKHGDVGKLWDGYRMGQIFRYNYVHDLYIRGEAGYTYDTPTDEQRAAGTPNVVSTNNGTDHPIYLNAGSGGYGTHFGDATGEAPEDLLGGQGYGNFWIHNNIFYNCSKGIHDRGTNYYPGTSTQLPYDSTKACYFINNTIINCGITTYGAPYGSLSFAHAAGQSPNKSMNNIYHFGDVDGSTAIYYWEKDSYSHNDIFISPLTGTHYGVPDLGDNFAITGNYSADDISISGQQYNLAQSEIWNDTSATVLCSTIGFGSTYIPDVRIIVDSEADNTGKAWSLLGDNYTVSSVLVEWTDTHTLGQDPTGRSFAYDIFGTQRTRNIIGAVKRVGD